MLTPRISSGDERSGDRQVPRLIGREPELARIQAFLASARTDGGALLVTGDPGVGKTELLNAASAMGSAAGLQVIRAAGVEFEAEMSYAGLNQVLLPLLTYLPELPAVHRDALNVALGFGEGLPPTRLVVSNATLALLRESTRSQPLLVIVDDLPWLDRASAGVLSFVARRVSDTRVRFLGAARTGEENFFERSGVPQLEVSRLDDASSEQLLSERYGDLDPVVRTRVVEEAEGNPLALLELSAALGPGRRASRQALPEVLPLGRRLSALYSSRIASLPRATRKLLLLMALDGTGDVRVLSPGRVADARVDDLAPAEEARLAYLDVATHRLMFNHPLIRSAVVELATAEERRAAHRALADAWEGQLDRRAWHLAESTVEPDELAAAQLEAAAARILARGDGVGCVKALTRSADLSPRAVDRQRRLAASAYVGAEVIGDLSNASQVLAGLRRGEIEVEGALQAAVAASTFLLWADGDIATAHRLLVGAIEHRLATQEGPDPILTQALQSLLMVCRQGASEELWRPFEAAMERVDDVPLDLDLNRRTFADAARATDAALQQLDSAIASLAVASDPTHIVRIATAATYVDRLGPCRDALWRVARDARGGGAVASGIVAMLELAIDDLVTGAWEEAEQLAEEALQLAEGRGYENLRWPARFHQLWHAAGIGEDDRLERLAAELDAWSAPRGIRAAQLHVSHARALGASGRSDFESAYQHASQISPPGVLAPHTSNALFVLLDLVESALRTNRVREAVAHVEVMRAAKLAAISPRLALVVGAAGAMVAPDDETFELFEEALGVPDIGRWRFDVARVRLLYGERLRRSRRMQRARGQLDAALDLFEAMGARPWVGRATAELRATGQTKPRAGESVLDRLTPQEFEIATLAATGLTNKQIAERLFLSHRTVGGHLHRAFPKLGVATRAALRGALDALPPEQRPLE